MNARPIETKVAAGGLGGLIVTYGLQLAQLIDPSMPHPSPGFVALTVTIVSGLLAYFAPHTGDVVQP